MSVHITSAILNCGPYFKGMERSVFFALGDAANDDGYCYPSVGEIALKAVCSERHVRRAVNSLRRLKFLSVEKGGGRTSNRYRIDVRALAKLAEHLIDVKEKAREAGVERFTPVITRARELRAERELAIAEAERAEELAALQAPKNVTRGDKVSPLNEAVENSDNVEFVTPARTSNVTPARTSDVRAARTPDVRGTIIEPLLEPPKEPSAPPEPSKRDALREALDKIEPAAKAIGLDYKTFRLKAGGPVNAARIAERFMRGKLSASTMAEWLETISPGSAEGTSKGRPAFAIAGLGAATANGLPASVSVGEPPPDVPFQMAA